jgi:hypothetical protein
MLAVPVTPGNAEFEGGKVDHGSFGRKNSMIPNGPWCYGPRPDTRLTPGAVPCGL